MLQDLGIESIQLSLAEISNTSTSYAHNNLVCRNCVKFCHPPFYSCQNSHLYCQSCSIKRSVCIICRENIEQKNMPHLERIHSVLKFPCNNWSYGCHIFTEGHRILEHQENCNYTIIACPVKTCKRRNPAGIIFNHLENVHSEFLFPDILHSKRIFLVDLMSEGVVLKNIIEYHDMIFLVRIYVSITGNFMRFIATNFGPYKGVEDFTAVVFFKQTDGKLWPLSMECRFTQNNENINSGFIRKRIDKLKLHENFYYDHQVGIAPTFVQ